MNEHRKIWSANIKNESQYASPQKSLTVLTKHTFVTEAWSFPTCNNFFSANATKQELSPTSKTAVIPNTCASQFFKDRIRYFQKYSTNDSTCLRQIPLHTAEWKPNHYLYDRIFVPSSSQVIEILSTVSTRTQWQLLTAQHRPLPLSATTQSRKRIPIPRKCTAERSGAARPSCEIPAARGHCRWRREPALGSATSNVDSDSHPMFSRFTYAADSSPAFPCTARTREQSCTAT